MSDTFADLTPYQYPVLTDEDRRRLKQLDHAIKRLEANLITGVQPATNQSSQETTELTEQPVVPSSDTTNTQEALTLSVDYAHALNANQLLAATTITGKALVIAGAGSGKTKTLTYRTSYLIENKADPSSILLLTFTRKSANEIKARVQSLLADTYANSSLLNRITSGTFHSFCHGLLRRYAGLIGIHPRFTILDTLDAEDAIDIIKKDKNYELTDKKQAFPKKSVLQKIISASRNRRILIPTLIENEYPALTGHSAAIEKIATDYHKYKRSNHLYDFDDIIGQVVRHLKENRRFLQLVQQQYRHIMVDEYQDTNMPQKQLIDLICAPKETSLMVVGDDNQSIYAFRGANYENILLFGDTYPDAALLKLEQNYRSTPAILKFINALSDNITLGYRKTLFSGSPIDGDPPTFSRFSNDSKEAKFIADKIVTHSDIHTFKDFAVLCRTSYQTNQIQLEFMERGIPFYMVGGIKFIEKRHVKDVLALVKIIYNPNDTLSWHRILTLFAGIGSVTATRITQSIFNNNNNLEPLLAPKYNKRSDQLSKLYHTLKKAEAAPNVSALLEHLLTFYVPVLQTLESNWQEREQDFRVLRNLAEEHESLDDFLEHLALDPPNDSVATMSKKKQENDDAVVISTIHSAKGLEWPVVFVNALVDGQTPHFRSADNFEQLEEERRLFYVACSRAKTHLYLTSPDYFANYAGYFDHLSRFIAEVPADCLHGEKKKPPVKPKEPEWW